MEITASMVKKLREMTGAGIMDCKRALQEVDGDYDAAVEVLRKKGLASAQKKASRIAAEGIVMAKVVDDTKAAVVEVNSETDFVAKNEKFQNFVSEVVDSVLANDVADVEALLASPYAADSASTVKDALVGKIATIGENMNIRRFEKIEMTDGIVVPYIHAGGRIGVLVAAQADVVNDEIKECLKNVAMQVAALNAKYVDETEVPADYLEHEKEILKAAAKNENPNKPDAIIEKMIVGRLKKELKEVCLVDQIYVKDPEGKQTVGQYVASVAKAAGANVKVVKFVRFETGEGLAKKEENFAEEVAKQMGM